MCEKLLVDGLSPADFRQVHSLPECDVYIRAVAQRTLPIQG